MFSLQELVFYPAQGVGTVERIDHKDIGGVACDFYIVRIHANDCTLMVPVNNAAKVGLRLLNPPDEAKRILETLHGPTDENVFTGQNWNRRFREYTERLKNPDLTVVTGVLRELLLISRAKELSFGERRLQEQAMALVVGELAAVLKCSEDSLRDELLAHYAPPPVQDGAESA